MQLFVPEEKLTAALAENERLLEAKRMAGIVADRRSRENVALRAALQLVDNYWTDGIRNGAQPPWREVREALAHEQQHAPTIDDVPLRAKNEWLQAMQADACDLLETGQSGCIPGCAEDLRWTERCDKWLERHRAHEQSGT